MFVGDEEPAKRPACSRLGRSGTRGAELDISNLREKEKDRTNRERRAPIHPAKPPRLKPEKVRERCPRRRSQKPLVFVRWWGGRKERTSSSDVAGHADGVNRVTRELEAGIDGVGFNGPPGGGAGGRGGSHAGGEKPERAPSDTFSAGARLTLARRSLRGLTIAICAQRTSLGAMRCVQASSSRWIDVRTGQRDIIRPVARSHIGGFLTRTSTDT